MRFVHIRLDLEHERRKTLVFRPDVAVRRSADCGRRREAQIFFQKVLYAEIRHSRAEKHRRQLAAGDFFLIESLPCLIKQRDIVKQRLIGLFVQLFPKLRRVQRILL